MPKDIYLHGEIHFHLILDSLLYKNFLEKSIDLTSKNINKRYLGIPNFNLSLSKKQCEFIFDMEEKEREVVERIMEEKEIKKIFLEGSPEQQSVYYARKYGLSCEGKKFIFLKYKIKSDRRTLYDMVYGPNKSNLKQILKNRHVDEIEKEWAEEIDKHYINPSLAILGTAHVSPDEEGNIGYLLNFLNNQGYETKISGLGPDNIRKIDEITKEIKQNCIKANDLGISTEELYKDFMNKLISFYMEVSKRNY